MPNSKSSHHHRAQMHPRNRLKEQPDFKTLAVKFPKFQQFLRLDTSGQLKFNFKNVHALKCLAEVLLEEYFNLHVIIPDNSLIPTIPLRHNYVLWLEDLANFLKKAKEDVSVIDIGTGASCIYPLLIARENGWKVVGTEVNPESYKTAVENVKLNKLENLVKVKQLCADDPLLSKIVTESDQFTFSMCNPPFFDDTKTSVVEKKTEPRNAHTGQQSELVVTGGEVDFVKKIIDESSRLKTNLWYLKDGFRYQEKASHSIQDYAIYFGFQGYAKDVNLCALLNAWIALSN